MSGPTTDSPASDNSILLSADIGDRVILGGTQRGAALALSSVLGAAGAVIVLRHLGVSTVGRYGTVMSLIGMVYGLSDLGLTVTGVRELALCDTAEQQKTLLSHILGIRIVITALAVGIAIAFSASVGYPSAMVIGTAVAGAGVILQSAQAAIVLPLSVRMRNGALAVNQLLQQFALLLGFALAAVLGGEIVAFCAVQILVGAVLLSAVPWLLGRNAIARPRISSEHTYAVIRTGLPIAVASVVGVLYVRVLVILMSLLTDRTQQVGYFVTSSRVVEVAAGIPVLVIGVMLPVATAVARFEQQRLAYMTGRLAQFMLLAGVAASLLLWTLAPTILRVAGGPQYVGGTPVLQVQGFALITVFLGASWQTALIAMGQFRWLACALGGGLLALVCSRAILSFHSSRLTARLRQRGMARYYFARCSTSVCMEQRLATGCRFALLAPWSSRACWQSWPACSSRVRLFSERCSLWGYSRRGSPDAHDIRVRS